MKSLLASICLCFTVITSALAADFAPQQKNIEIVVPYPPGGATDRWGRVIQEIFTAQGWKSTVVNRPGADTVIGSNYVAEAAPDGHTLYIGGNGFLDANLAFRNGPPGIRYTENSFDAVVPLGAGTAVLAVAANVPVNNYEEFKVWVRKNPERFNLGFWNSYTANLFYVWAQRENLPRPNIVLYRGSAPQVADITGGHLPFAFDTFTALSQHVETGRVKIIAVLDSAGEGIVRRSMPSAKVFNIGRQYPELDVPIWYGLYAPAGVPRSVITQINTVVNSALKNPEHARAMESLHIGNFGGTPRELEQRQRRVLSIMRDTARAVE